MMYRDIDKHIADAMRTHDDVRLAVLRAIKTELVRKEKEGVSIDDTTEATVLNKMVAQREDSISQFKSANRMDLVESETKELIVLKEYAPKEVSEEDIVAETEHVIATMFSGSVTMKEMKAILSEVQKKYPTANGKIVSQIVKSHC